MLIDMDTGREITRMPFTTDFETLRERLTSAEFKAAEDRINELINNAGAEIATAGWLPGNNWTGTPFQPIHEKGAKGDPDIAGRLFGLLVWHVIMGRPEKWGSGRYQKDGKDIGSRTYFKLRAR